ncbi:hypothetical protein EDEG_01504 [Edhazardia aedis USNM 41457]|uniref:Uncharacterized protein n=1 Tax=Edhazardia aedis (strain USNM 41457) TaxID=1003232 RepID=J9D8W9_EDHAE|nr:hypothetical protein EDEG_01504 [Edhazardia aedis USNM 41457]|eukprot:EJW04206.1 hypothetical protein EDEG_01504 [Edhazardia aedis USNM 41457]
MIEERKKGFLAKTYIFLQCFKKTEDYNNEVVGIDENKAYECFDRSILKIKADEIQKKTDSRSSFSYANTNLSIPKAGVSEDIANDEIEKTDVEEDSSVLKSDCSDKDHYKGLFFIGWRYGKNDITCLDDCRRFLKSSKSTIDNPLENT